MALSVLDDRFSEPSAAEVEGVLGESIHIWRELIRRFQSRYQETSLSWRYYSKSSGWTLLLKRKQITVFSLFPQLGHFTVMFVFGEEAAAAVETSSLPIPVRSTVRNAKLFRDGRSFRIQVQEPEHLEVICKLVEIKLNH